MIVPEPAITTSTRPPSAEPSEISPPTFISPPTSKVTVASRGTAIRTSRSMLSVPATHRTAEVSADSSKSGAAPSGSTDNSAHRSLKRSPSASGSPAWTRAASPVKSSGVSMPVDASHGHGGETLTGPRTSVTAVEPSARSSVVPSGMVRVPASESEPSCTRPPTRASPVRIACAMPPNRSASTANVRASRRVVPRRKPVAPATVRSPPTCRSDSWLKPRLVPRSPAISTPAVACRS